MLTRAIYKYIGSYYRLEFRWPWNVINFLNNIEPATYLRPFVTMASDSAYQI